MYQKAKVEASEKEHIAAPASTMLADAWIRLKKNKAAVVALFILVAIILLAIFAPIFSKYSFRDTDYNNVYGLPSAAHIFGADQFGRDLWVRTWMGTRISLMIALVAAILDLVVGVLYGAVSALFGGKVDAVMQRIVELIYAVPEMLVVLLIATAMKPILTEYVNSAGNSPMKSFVSVLGPNLISMFIAFGMLYWVTMSRIIRGQVLQLKQQEYVTAARALGASGGRIIRRHLLPNCIGQIVVTTCLQIPSAIFLESFLSYLGVGVSAPLPSLGSMATDALGGMYTYTYRLIVPSVILSVMILAFNLFGDGLRDALDPKLKK